MLFTADLRSFSDRLAASKKSKVEVDVDIKEERNDDFEVETKVTTALAVKRSLPAGDDKDEMKKVKKEGKDDEEETKGKLNGVAQASQTTTTRRMSKRLQNR